jgi:hypothetical protein
VSTIVPTGEIHEFAMNTSYFTVTPQEFYYVTETERSIEEWKEWFPQQIKDELMKMGGGIIWWRVTPEIDHAKIGWDGWYEGKKTESMTEEEKMLADKYFCWKGYARLATSPPLPESAVSRLTDSFEGYQRECRRLRYKAIAAITEGVAA